MNKANDNIAILALIQDSSFSNSEVERTIAILSLKLIAQLEEGKVSVKDAEKMLYNGRVYYAICDRDCSNLCREIIGWGIDIGDFEEFSHDISYPCREIKHLSLILLAKEQGIKKQPPKLSFKQLVEIEQQLKDICIQEIIHGGKIPNSEIEETVAKLSLYLVSQLEQGEISVSEAREMLYNDEIWLALDARGCSELCVNLVGWARALEDCEEYNPLDMQDVYDRIKEISYQILGIQFKLYPDFLEEYFLINAV